MPQLIQHIDDIAARLSCPILMLRFGPDDQLGDRVEITAKRERTLERLRQAGITIRPCAPPSTSGWLSYLGDVYFDVPWEPGTHAYEEIVGMFEAPDGGMRDADVRLCVYRAA